MRVAFIRSKSDGGIEPRLLREARVLARAGHDVHVLLWDRTGAFPKEERYSNLTVHRVHLRAPYNRWRTLFRLPRFYRAVRDLLATIGPDVVHVCDFDAFPPARGFDGPIVFDAWDFWSLMITSRWVGPVRSWLWAAETEAIEHADRLLLPMAGRIGALPNHRAFVEITNSPEEDVRPFPTSHDSTVAYVGNMASDRGLIPLAHACRLAGASLVMAGSGPDEKRILLKFARVLNGPRIRFVGRVSHDAALTIQGSADLVAALYDPRVPNNRWAAPNRLFEAMMMGRPILTNGGTLLADFVREWAIGFVASSLDSETLRFHISYAFAHPEICEEMGRRARALYESRYTWAIMARRLTTCYRGLLVPPEGG